MRLVLDDESRIALIKYRLDRAYSTYSDAVDAFERGSYNSAINRLYYACFYAVLALLLKDKVEAKTHEGVKRMFCLNYIANKKIEGRFNTFYSELFQGRIQGDYDDFFLFDQETTQQFIFHGKEFIELLDILCTDNMD